MPTTEIESLSHAARARVLCCSLALCWAAACGGADAPAPAESAQTATAAPAGQPVIDGITLEPPAAAPGEPLKLQISAHDPEGDELQTEIQWFVNQTLYRENSNPKLDTSKLRRGDHVYAVVKVSDATSSAQSQSPIVTLGNALPRVNQIAIKSGAARGTQPVTVEVGVFDPEEDPVKVVYEWSVDGKVIPQQTGDTLPAGLVKRGQKLVVRAAARDPQGQGPWTESAEVVVGNSEPVIESKPPLGLAGPQNYEYQIKAVDPDGDHPLRYELTDGPSGMDVDFISGLLTWNVPNNVKPGKIPIEVACRDAYGGTARQRYELTIQWEDVPADQD